MIRKLIYKMRKRRFCKLNRWFCPDCIYHDFVFEGGIFRGNKCRYPQYEERKERGMKRKDALWVMKMCRDRDARSEAEREAFDTAIEALKSESIFTADRPRGEWIDIDNYYRLATCSQCHKVTMFEKWGEHTKPYKFCPNCGADMRGDTE